MTSPAAKLHDAKQRVVAIAARSSPVWARRRRRGGGARQVVRVPLTGAGVCEHACEGVRWGARA
jgi:hypothetical protein